MLSRVSVTNIIKTRKSFRRGETIMEQMFFPATRREAKRFGIQYSSDANKNAGFPSRLRELRKEKGVSQDTVSKELKISKSTLGLWETGDTLPDAKGIFDLSLYYGVSTDYLLGKTEITSTDLKIREVCEYIGLSESSVKNILSIVSAGKKPGVEVAAGYALNRIISSESFASMIEAAASLVGKGTKDPSLSCESKLCTTLSEIEANLKEKYNFDFYILYGSAVRDAYIKDVLSYLEEILNDMFYEVELKKQKPIEERTLGELRRMPKDDMCKIISKI